MENMDEIRQEWEYLKGWKEEKEKEMREKEEKKMREREEKEIREMEEKEIREMEEKEMREREEEEKREGGEGKEGEGGEEGEREEKKKKIIRNRVILLKDFFTLQYAGIIKRGCKRGDDCPFLHIGRFTSIESACQSLCIIKIMQI